MIRSTWHTSDRRSEGSTPRTTITSALLVLTALIMLLGGSATAAFAGSSAAITPRLVYSDARVAGWEDWSWGDVRRTFTNAAPVHGGSASIRVQYVDPWSGFKLARSNATGPLTVAGYDVLRFWVHGGTGGKQNIVVNLLDGARQVGVTHPVRPTAGAWTRVDVPLTCLSTKQVTAIEWSNNTAGAQPTYYLDDIAFVDLDTTGGPALCVDAAIGRRAISPDIYGMHYTSEAFAKEIRLPVRRWGGNDTTRYNWKINRTNNGYDWYFENNRRQWYFENNPPQDLSADGFVDRDRRTQTQTIITLPMSGWVARNGTACGFNTDKYTYTPLPYPNNIAPATDPNRPACGTGIVSYTDGKPNFYSGNNPTDTSIAVGPPFTASWVQHLVATFGKAADGGVRFYGLDNEPDLWHETHIDIRPEPLTYDELVSRSLQYAAAIKAADPTAKTLGPVSFGWPGYWWSAYDLAEGEKNGYTSFPDREAHNNVPLVVWYLRQMAAYDAQPGRGRLLDYLDLHFYPQNGVGLRDAGDAATQAKRLRSTRALWDPTYLDESYIGEDPRSVDMRYVRLIPRMRDWVWQNYRGTKLAITEYNWGALDHINGALAQADILGIFGREGVDLATLFDSPYGTGGKLTPTSPGAYAFRMYRNYNGTGGSFGDTSVRSGSADQGKLAVYAALRQSDGALTLMIVNKTGSAQASKVAVKNFAAGGPARVYRYSAANLGAIVGPSNQSITATGFSATFPASSITLVVVPPGAQGLGVGD